MKGVFPLNDLKRVFSFLKPFRKEFLAAILFVIAETGFELVIPLLMADIIDTGIPSRDEDEIYEFYRENLGLE